MYLTGPEYNGVNLNLCPRPWISVNTYPRTWISLDLGSNFLHLTVFWIQGQGSKRYTRVHLAECESHSLVYIYFLYLNLNHQTTYTLISFRQPKRRPTPILVELLSNNKPNRLDGIACNNFQDSLFGDASNVAQTVGILKFH